MASSSLTASSPHGSTALDSPVFKPENTTATASQKQTHRRLSDDPAPSTDFWEANGDIRSKIFGLLPKPDWVTCRGVSRSWKMEVEREHVLRQVFGPAVTTPERALRIAENDHHFRRGHFLKKDISNYSDCVDFLPNNSLVTNWCHRVEVYEPGQFDAPIELSGHTNKVTSVAVSSDGSFIASGSVDGAVHLWDSRDLRAGVTNYGELQRHRGEIATMTISCNDLLASGAMDKRVNFWDLKTSQCPGALYFDEYPTSIAFKPGASVLAVGLLEGTNSLLLSDYRTGKTVGIPSLVAPSRGVSSIAFSPCGDQLAVGDHEKQVNLWDLRANKMRPILKADSSPFWYGKAHVAFSPGGWLAYGERGSLHLVDIHAAAESSVKFDLLGHIKCLAFSPTASMLACVDSSPRTNIWDFSPRAGERSNTPGDTIAPDRNPDTEKSLSRCFRLPARRTAP